MDGWINCNIFLLHGTPWRHATEVQIKAGLQQGAKVVGLPRFESRWIRRHTYK